MLSDRLVPMLLGGVLRVFVVQTSVLMPYLYVGRDA